MKHCFSAESRWFVSIKGKISEFWISLDLLFPDVFFIGLEREFLWFWIINHSLVRSRPTILGEYNNILTDMLIYGFTCWLHCPLFKIRQLTLRFFSVLSRLYINPEWTLEGNCLYYLSLKRRSKHMDFKF